MNAEEAKMTYVRREGREPLPDHAGESPLLSPSGGEKGLRGSGARIISWLQSPSAVILEPRKIKSDTDSTVSPEIPRNCVQDAVGV